MLIKVKTLTGKEIEVDIEPLDKVIRIKERLEEKEGIPPEQQRLIFSGKQMNDEKSANDYKVKGGSVLHLVLALRGGIWAHKTVKRAVIGCAMSRDVRSAMWLVH